MGKFCIMLAVMLLQNTFKETQLKNARVKTAYSEKEDVVKAYFKEKNIKYNGFRLFIRAFKKEQKLETWVLEEGKETYALLHTYDFCAVSGKLGPKRKEGDLQIPEGVYSINHFNPQSNFYLSLGVSYPNASDRILSDQKHPGGNIYIHGNCVTIGCIPLTDDKIKELYVLAVQARGTQDNIPVHIFPAKLSSAELNALKTDFSAPTISFWTNLKKVYDDFEQTKKLKQVKVTKTGDYAL